MTRLSVHAETDQRSLQQIEKKNRQGVVERIVVFVPFNAPPPLPYPPIAPRISIHGCCPFFLEEQLKGLAQHGCSAQTKIIRFKKLLCVCVAVVLA
jgi:hypothetical protein